MAMEMMTKCVWVCVCGGTGGGDLNKSQPYVEQVKQMASYVRITPWVFRFILLSIPGTEPCVLISQNIRL